MNVLSQESSESPSSDQKMSEREFKISIWFLEIAQELSYTLKLIEA